MANTGTEMAVVNVEMSYVSGISPAILTLESVIAEIAPTRIPVLLIGESGAGKEQFARRIHQLSRQASEALRTIPSAALNAATFATEVGLSGNDDGNRANGATGTIVLDEISELDMSCQRALLYALPDGDTNRRGILNSRVISTTSRNLDEEMRAGRFRSELYYRLNGVCLRLPALRERKEDIPLLIEYFLTKHSAELGRPRPVLRAHTVRQLLDQSWPGNIRELENVMKKIVVLGEEGLAISETTPPAPIATTGTEKRKEYSLKAAARAASRKAEKELILGALERTRWNRKRAAQELQISYKSLLYKLKQIGLSSSEEN